jgi:MurE/MurF fusion protein
LSQILAGVAGHDAIDVMENRAEAIAYTVANAGPADVILIAGKGHERTQEILGVKTPFEDEAHARAGLMRRLEVTT